MKNKILIIIAILLIIIGIGIFSFPYISNYIYEKKVINQEQIFIENSKKEIIKNDLDELYENLQIENQEIFENKQNKLTDPFAYEQNSINLEKYGLFDNVIAYVEVPKMEIKLPILLGANKENMKKGAGHLTETSYPIGGLNTNCVLAAHRGYARAAFFRDIENLALGDVVFIQNFREKLEYRVCEIKIISPDEVNQIKIQEGRDLLTLITCHPYTKNYQRYVVICERA